MKSKFNFSATRGQHLYRHKSGTNYARVSVLGKKTWRTLKTSVLSIARPRLAKMLTEEQGRQELLGDKAASGPKTFGEVAQLRLRKIARDVSIKSRTKLSESP